MFNGELQHAILETLAYSDIFEFPLRSHEIHRHLPLPASHAQVFESLTSTMDGRLETREGYYFLKGRVKLVEIRKRREAYSQSLLPIAKKYGRVLGSLPFVRMVGLTGSLAVLNVSKDPDFDYMLVTAPGRLWTARAFALLLNRMVKRIGYTICPNLIVAETALEWPLQDLYSARELSQMLPITGMDVYQRLLKANAWAQAILPNAFPDANGSPLTTKEQGFSTVLQRTLEAPLRSRTGGRFERWEMDRKIARFTKQDGFGEETNFTAEVCQGNFHHHRQGTREAFEKTLKNISVPYMVSSEIPESPALQTAMRASKS